MTLTSQETAFVDGLIEKLSARMGWNFQWAITEAGALVVDEAETRVVYTDIPKSSVSSRFVVSLWHGIIGDDSGRLTNHMELMEKLQLQDILRRVVGDSDTE
jgi:hypothetical protein